MIFAVVEYRKCTIDLLQKDNTHKLMRKRELAKRQFQFAKRLDLVRQTKRSADDKGYIAISRNRRLGEKLGSGLSLEEAKKEVGTIAEGVNSVQSVYDIARKNNLKTPIVDAIWKIVCEGKKTWVLLHAMGFTNRGNK